MYICVTDKRVYRAEWRFADLLDTTSPTVTAFGSTIPTPIEIKFSPESGRDIVQRYVHKLCADPAFVDRYGEQLITVIMDSRLRRRAYALGNTINMPNKRWAWRESVVLHEVAHVVTPLDYTHGPRFLAEYTWLVSQYMGAEAGWLLSALLQDTNNQIGEVA